MSETSTNTPAYRFCVAPMLDVTDKHARFFYRRLSQHALLYTEMITTGAILYGDAKRFLAYDPKEHPVALQLGGNDPDQLARCTTLANRLGYDEINLNVGCPSNRVQAGCFGASLMKQPQLVRDCVAAMSAHSSVPITVKCRLGVDRQEDYSALLDFVDCVAEAPCSRFIIHARKAWLDGLNPKQNRDIPPLRYEWVYRLKQQRPQLKIIINGGIQTIDACLHHLNFVDGVMLGREIQQNPMFLTTVDQTIYNQPISPPQSGSEIIKTLIPYIEDQCKQGVPLQHMTRHLVSFVQAVKGARKFRRYLSENAYKKGAEVNIISDALSFVDNNSDHQLLSVCTNSEKAR